MAAYELGFIDAGELAERIESTLATIEKLDRFEGHLFNWYDSGLWRLSTRDTSRRWIAAISPLLC